MLFKLLDHVGQVKVKSVTDPLFKYGMFPLGFGAVSAAMGAETWVIIFLFCTGGLFLILGLGFYWFFAVKAP